MSARRIGAGAIDQGLSSLANIIVSIALARSLSTEAFGEASLALVGFGAILGVVRGLLGSWISRIPTPASIREESSFALTAAIWIGIATCLFYVIITLTSDTHWSVGIVGVGAAFAVPQDVLRWSGFALNKSAVCIASDGTWLMVTLISLFASPNALNGMLVPWLWATGALAGLLILVYGLDIFPHAGGMVEWAKRERRMRFYFGLDAVLSSWNGIANLTLAAALIGVAGTAGLRGAGVLLGPVAMLLSAAPMVLIPLVSRSGKGLGGKAMWHRLRAPAGLLAIAAATLGMCAYALPPQLGEALLGESWTWTRRVVLIVGLEYAGLAFMQCTAVGLKALNLGRELFLIRLGYSILSIFLIFVFGSLYGTPEAVATALAVAAAVFGLLATWALAGSSRSRA